MNFNKFCTVDSILEKVVRDTELTQFTREDASEWTWECLGKLGIPSLLKDSNCILELNDYRGVLPPDFYSIQGVRRYVDKIVLNPTIYEFWRDYRGYTTTNKTLDDGANVITVMSDNYNNWESPANHYIGSYSSGTTYMPVRQKYIYKIDGDYIYCGFQNDSIEIAYKSIPVYNDFTPMIPDDERVKAAVTSTIIFKLFFREYIKGNVSRQMKEDAEQEYLFAIASARNRAIMPDAGEWELLKNRSMAILKSHKSHDTSFSIWGMKNSGMDKSL